MTRAIYSKKCATNLLLIIYKVHPSSMRGLYPPRLEQCVQKETQRATEQSESLYLTQTEPGDDYKNWKKNE